MLQLWKAGSLGEVLRGGQSRTEVLIVIIVARKGIGQQIAEARRVKAKEGKDMVCMK